MHTEKSGHLLYFSYLLPFGEWWTKKKKSVNFQFYEILNAGAKHRAPAAVDREPEGKKCSNNNQSTTKVGWVALVALWRNHYQMQIRLPNWNSHKKISLFEMNIYEPCTIHGSHALQPHAINRIFFSLEIDGFSFIWCSALKWMFPPLLKIKGERTEKKTLLFLNKICSWQERERMKKKIRKKFFCSMDVLSLCDSVNRKWEWLEEKKTNMLEMKNLKFNNNNNEIQLFNLFTWNALCGFLLMNQLENSPHKRTIVAAFIAVTVNST